MPEIPEYRQLQFSSAVNRNSASVMPEIPEYRQLQFFSVINRISKMDSTV